MRRSSGLGARTPNQRPKTTALPRVVGTPINLSRASQILPSIRPSPPPKLVQQPQPNIQSIDNVFMLKNIIDEIIFTKKTDISFLSVYKIVKSINNNDIGCSIYGHLKNQMSIFLDSFPLKSIQQLIELWKIFLTKIRYLQSFLQFLCRNKDEQRKKLTPFMFEEYLRNKKFKVQKISFKLWKTCIHTKSLNLFGKQINDKMESIASGEFDSITIDLFNMYRDLGINCVGSIAKLLTSEYALASKAMTAAEKARFLIDETKAMASVFPLSQLQEATLIPYLHDFIQSLFSEYEEDLLLELKYFITDVNIRKFDEEIARCFKHIKFSNDLFDISAYLRYYSSFMVDDSRIKEVVSKIINQQDFNIAELFSTVVIGSYACPSNLKSLAPIFSLINDKKNTINLLRRKYYIKLITDRKQPTLDDKEFLSDLCSILSRDQVSVFESYLHDFTVKGNFVLINQCISAFVSLSDKSMIPPEIKEDVTRELQLISSQYENRTYSVSGVFSLINIKAKWGKSEIFIVMTFLQYNILKMIEIGDFEFYKTGASNEFIKGAIQMLAKSKIIEVENKIFKISRNPPKLGSKRINLYKSTISRKPEKTVIEQKANSDQMIQAKIAQIMKSKRRIMKDDLFNITKESVSNLVSISKEEFDSSIKRLINSQFIEEDSNDSRFYIYVP